MDYLKKVFTRFPAFMSNDGRIILFKNVSLLFVGNIFSRGLNLISYIILAKALTTEDYGTLTVILSVITTMGDLINSGLTASTMRFTSQFAGKNNKEKISRLLATISINTVLLTIAFVGVSVIFSGTLSHYFLNGNYETLLIVAAFGLFTTFIFSNLYSMLQGLEDFSGMILITTIFGLERLIAIFTLSTTNNLSIQNGVYLFVVTPLIAIIVALSRLRMKHKLSLNFFNNYDFAIFKETLGFGKWMSAWSVVSIIQSRLDIYLLSSLTTSTQVSYYDIAQKFSSIVGMGLSAYANVINPQIAKLTKKMLIINEVKKSLKVTLLMSTMLIAGIFILPPVIQLIFGDKYSDALTPLRIMLGGLFFYMLTFPYNSAMYALGKSRAFFYTVTIQLIGNLIASYILLPRLGAIGASFSFVIVNFIAFICSYFFYRKYINAYQDEDQS